MDAFSRPSQCGFPSDTYQLVDACIERVRAVARLDDDAVLPPLPAVAPRRDVVILTKSEVTASVGGAYATGPAPNAARGRRDLSATYRIPRPDAGRSRWALALCALVAGAAASAAFLASPAAQDPDVTRVTRAAQAQAARAARATAALVPW